MTFTSEHMREIGKLSPRKKLPTLAELRESGQTNKRGGIARPALDDNVLFRLLAKRGGA